MMKKWILVLSVIGCMFSAGPVQASDWMEKIVLYIPNRLVDAMDMFTVNLGAGPVVEAQLMGTRVVWGGGGIGMSYKLCKAYNRQYGIGREQGYYWSLVGVSEDYTSMDWTMGLMKKYKEMYSGFPTPAQRTYDWHTGARDYWAIGGSLGCLVTGDLYIHPLEWLDFGLGFLFIDIKGDDFIFDDFR